MLRQETIEKMNGLKLFGMVSSFETQLSSSEYSELGFEERLGLLVDAEWTEREQRKLRGRLKVAKLRYEACLENVNFQAPRGLHREPVLSLGSCRWITEHQNLLISGPTGIGKSFLACAFVERACRRGFTGYYVRAPRLIHELAVARGDGSYSRILSRLAKLDLLAIDDWLLHPLKEAERRDVMEVIEDRTERGSILIASQLPVKNWHAAIGDPNQADAICDRLLHRAHKIQLDGPSLRDTNSEPKPSDRSESRTSRETADSTISS
jgi:DNA replication protein DnaC